MLGIVRNCTSKILPLARPTIIQKASLVSGPPKNRISFAEKLTLGGLMIAVVCAPGAWIMAHILDYRGAR
ncbi:hypothetical protein ScPMuIL_014341 [Solemya velum]